MKFLKKMLVFGLISLILNLVWEFSHHFLYIDLSGIPEYPHLIMASFMDMFILLGIFATVSLKNRNFSWAERPGKADYLLIVFMGFLVAALIEIVNLNLGRWEYTQAMPTLFGIGISPLIQLALTGVISLFLSRKFFKILYED